MKTKIDFFKIGSLLYYQYQTYRELSSGTFLLFDTDFKERANDYLSRYGIYEHYSSIDLRLYVGNRKPSDFEKRIMKSVKLFESKCLTLGLIDHIKHNAPDIASINTLISKLNQPTKLIDANIRQMILNEFCSIETIGV